MIMPVLIALAAWSLLSIAAAIPVCMFFARVKAMEAAIRNEQP